MQKILNISAIKEGYMKASRREFLISASLLTLLISDTFGQGGKAGPKEIKFQKGASSATIKDYIKGDEEAEYSFNARKGQLVTISISSNPTNNILLTTKDPNFEDVKTKIDDKNQYSFTLNQSGEFFLSFQCVKKSPKKTDYSFTISIK
jgi:hypothetical protein